MYVPPHFREEDVPALHEAIRGAGLANLVTYGPDGLVASPVPMLLDPEPGPYGALVGHLSKANPQWRGVAPDVDALAMFPGPDAYVSPSWYATKRETGKVVPTWNYVAVHAYGPVEFFTEEERLLDLLRGLTGREEAGRAEPWTIEDAPADYVRGQLKGIVGFRLTIHRLEGKWKMSQNRSEPDRAGVVEGLSEEGNVAVAGLVARTL